MDTCPEERARQPYPRRPDRALRRAVPAPRADRAAADRRLQPARRVLHRRRAGRHPAALPAPAPHRAGSGADAARVRPRVPDPGADARPPAAPRRRADAVRHRGRPRRDRPRRHRAVHRRQRPGDDAVRRRGLQHVGAERDPRPGRGGVRRRRRLLRTSSRRACCPPTTDLARRLADLPFVPVAGMGLRSELGVHRSRRRVVRRALATRRREGLLRRRGPGRARRDAGRGDRVHGPSSRSACSAVRFPRC